MSRLTPEERKHLILEAAVELAIYAGYEKITREDVAAMADCSVGLVNHYYKDLEQLKEAVVTYAVGAPLPEILAEAMVYKSPLVANIPDELRIQAAKCLIKRG